MPLVSQLLSSQDNILGWILQVGWFISIFFFVFYGQRLQLWNMLREIEGSLFRFKLMKEEGRRTVMSTIKEIGKPQDDLGARVDRFLEYVAIEPVNLDPAGIVWKLEHILDVREDRFRDDVKLMAPGADETRVRNLENLLEVSLILNLIYKVIRHFYILGKKTKSLYVIMQVQMSLPLLMREAKALTEALGAFREGHPIGDGAGALVAAKLMRASKKTSIAKDVVMAEVPIEERTAYILKAEGPGGNVGKPGEAIKRVVEKNDGKIATIIMVDAGVKFEGETPGEIAEGVGVAIGGPGVEKYKVDESILKHKIPVNAVIIKESFRDAISTMRREIVDAVDVAIERIKRIIREKTKVGDSIIIAGIGNTTGIGQ